MKRVQISVDARCVLLFCCFSASGIFVLAFILLVVLTCIAAVYIPWPLLPAFVNDEAGNLMCQLFAGCQPSFFSIAIQIG